MDGAFNDLQQFDIRHFFMALIAPNWICGSLLAVAAISALTTQLICL